MEKEKTSERTRFVAVRRNSGGTLSEFKDNNGKTYDYEQTLETVEQGTIENALPSTRCDGARYIREINDGDEPTDLRNLKEF